ncbi:Hypothetical protein R9X50_00050400 [Acrodontium crateriforme]|uniref:Signal peptide peptidase n=1 Tax=Acrodontium crateriforme TaxID=150365 RepID=A0AAQ3LXE7_9PEZI|nr:Hypothetical protein R9X50_00050400 [Acrodontium crateriforme]
MLTMASTSFPELLQAAARHFEEARPLLPMYGHLIVSALFPIYTGSYASLSRPSSAAKAARKEKKVREDEDDEDEEDEESEQKMEGLSPSDAIIFPITAALMLAGLYFLIKRYGADAINLILGWYFAAVGVFSVGRLINDAAGVAVTFIFPTYFGDLNGNLWKVDAEKRKAIAEQVKPKAESNSPFPLWTPMPAFVTNRLWNLRATVKQRYATKIFLYEVVDFTGNLTIINFLSALLGLASIIYANLGGKPWWLTNLQGFAVCYSALQFMSPTSFTTGSLILMSLFCYDVWAVFFTPLMVTVAKNLDQPIKLVFPRPDEPSDIPGEPPIKSFSMLGLGDIVLPGLMIGLALRFDLYMFYLKKQKLQKSTKKNAGEDENSIVKTPYIRATGRWGDRFWTTLVSKSNRPAHLNVSFPKPYFTAALIGYIFGMLATLGVMSVFQHAQPALLYLVPGVLISLWGAGLVRGEVKEMWNFSEAITGQQFDDDDDDSQSAEKDENKKDQGKKEGQSWITYLWREIVGSDEHGSEDETSKKSGMAEDGDSKKDLIVAFSVARYVLSTKTETKPHTKPRKEDDDDARSTKSNTKA